MVIGEPQILGQLRTAYAGAEQAGTVGRTLHDVAQQALRVGKRVHTETGINAASASVLSEALSASATALGGPHASGLAGRIVMLLGAGSLGGLAAAQLRRAGVAEIILGNRTPEKAQRLATLCKRDGTPARVISLDAVRTAIPAVDLVICCTAATGSLITTEDVSARRRPVVVCDLGLPRNVEAGVGDLPGVNLIDLPAVALDGSIAAHRPQSKPPSTLSPKRCRTICWLSAARRSSPRLPRCASGLARWSTPRCCS
jgi:glutamyl-tRNA reductase